MPLWWQETLTDPVGLGTELPLTLAGVRVAQRLPFSAQPIESCGSWLEDGWKQRNCN